MVAQLLLWARRRLGALPLAHWVPSVARSSLGGVGVLTTGSSSGFDASSSKGLSDSSTISTIRHQVAFLSASFYWS